MVVYNNDTDVYVTSSESTEYVSAFDYETTVCSINDGVYASLYTPIIFITTHIGWLEPSASIY